MRLASSVLALGLFFGCHRTASTPVITVIPKEPPESMWVNEHVGIAEAAARQRVNIYWNGPTGEEGVAQQIDLADRAIKNRDLGLILSPTNPFALNTVVKRSLAAGMSVVIVGDPLSLKPEKRLSFVLNDEDETGALAAGRIKRILNGRGEVLVVGIDPFLPGNPDRSSAFEATLNKDAPGIKIVDRLTGTFSFGQAELAVEKSILAHPHLTAIVSLDIPATRGTIAAVRTTHTSKQISIVGCNQDLDLLFLLRRGVIDSLIAQNTRAMGAMAVDFVMDENRGLPVAPYTLVKPVLMTKENIDDETIQHLLYMKFWP
jgi:ABC-type sugar transport system substrate-binding protein